MLKTSKKLLRGAIVCVVGMLLVLNVSSVAQEKKQEEDKAAKLLAEISGSYEFEFEGQFIVFVFSVEEGKLMAAPEGETQEALEPVEGEEMSFVGYSPTGDEYQIKFERDDEGKIARCIISVPAMGIELVGERIDG